MVPQRAEANLSALIESTEDLIWSVDLNYGLLTFNRAFHDNIQGNFGIQSAVGMRPEDLLPPARAALLTPLYERALSEGPFRAEYPLVDGRTLELAFNPIVQDGETTGISVFGKDITERKTAEGALREAEEKYREIFEGALEGIFRTSFEGKPVAVNPAFAKMLGYESPQEFTSTVTDTARQLWHDPNERSRVFQLLEQQGVVRGDECQLKRKDGTSIWASFNSRKVCGKDGRTLYYEGFIEDITASKRIEDALRRAEEQFATAFLGSPTAKVLARIESEGNPFVDANEAFERLTGYRREEVIGRTGKELGLFADPREYDEYLKQFRGGGRVRSFEFHFRRKSGEIGTGLISAESMELDGEPWMITTTIDITERRHSERQYRLLFNSMQEGVALHKLIGSGGVPENYLLLDVNRRFEELLGMQREDVVNRLATDVYRTRSRSLPERVRVGCRGGKASSV